MSTNCNSQCSTCNVDCSDRTEESRFEPTNEFSNIKKVVAVVSGKGGVGKSSITSMLAVLMNRKGYKVGVLDADITGPSIPKTFGIKEKALGNEHGLFPAKTMDGINLMSVNLILEKETDPVVWRGPVIAGAVKQFWSEVLWGDIDYMFIDMPPGTGDVPITVFQSLPIDGIVIVSSPQSLVGMIATKAVNMAKAMDIPIVGIVENMSYVQCPDCDKKIEVFGKSRIDEIAREHEISTISKLPLDPSIASLCDLGQINKFEGDFLNNLADEIEKI